MTDDTSTTEGDAERNAGRWVCPERGPNAPVFLACDTCGYGPCRRRHEATAPEDADA